MRKLKDSGIEWIGEIPRNKRIIRNKYLLEYTKGKLPVDTNFEGTGFPYIGATDLDSHEPCKTYTRDETLPDACDSDLLVLWDGARAGLCGTHKVGKVSSTIVRIREVDSTIYRPFLYWYYKGFEDYMYQRVNGTTIPHMNRKYIEEIQMIDWTIQEQCRIVDYLDRKCSQIDAIIARQQEVIEKLKAYKLSVITEAVTKGLNPNVPMKDSGVEWIGEIPEHWKMVRLKFLLSHIIDCPHETPIYSADGDYLVIRTADQDLGKLRTDEDMYRLDEGEYQNRIRRMPLEKDDIVYGREGERWGLACLVPESNKYCLGQRMLQFRCKRELFLPRFAMWALNSKFVYLQGAVDTIGSTSPHVNISTVRNFLIPVPNINEQQEIVEYVDKKMSQLDKEVEHREMLICKLNEYKKSLIFEVVTGKKEV